jgi:stearoyl-CoA desaturase (delta-9 desaturase)
MEQVLTRAEPIGAKVMKREVDLKAIIAFSAVVLAAVVGVPLYGLTYGYTALDWTLFGILYVVTGLGITVGYHRMISHRAFTCPAPVKVALLIAGGWAFQNSAIKWCGDHLRHHAFTDQEQDPYDARRGFWYSHCGWLMFKDPYADDKYYAPFRKDRWNVWQQKYYFPILISGFIFPFLVGFASGGLKGGLGCFMLAGVGRVFLVLNSTFCINSLSHMWGDQPYGTKDTSRDNFWIAFITLGEGFHNYHHAYPRDYRNGVRWYHFDPSKWLIFILSKLGLAGQLVRAAQKSTA